MPLRAYGVYPSVGFGSSSEPWAWEICAASIVHCWIIPYTSDCMICGFILFRPLVSRAGRMFTILADELSVSPLAEDLCRTRKVDITHVIVLMEFAELRWSPFILCETIGPLGVSTRCPSPWRTPSDLRDRLSPRSRNMSVVVFHGWKSCFRDFSCMILVVISN